LSTEWTAGYVTDVNYTFGYYAELNPLRCRLPLLLAGCHAPIRRLMKRHADVMGAPGQGIIGQTDALGI